MQFSSLVALLLVVVLSICSINAQNPVVAYAGSTDGQGTYNPPTGGSGSSCTADSSDYAYVVFNVTFATSGLRQVTMLTQESYNYVYVYVNGFNPATPCANLYSDDRGYYLTNQYDTEPDIDAVVWFNASLTYYIVIAGDTNTDLTDVDYFAINIFEANFQGNTFDSNSYWPGVEDTTDGDTSCSSYDSEADLPYGNYTWTQQTSGWYDIAVGFYNATDYIDYVYAALYNATNINVTNPCQPSFVVASTNDYGGTYFYYVWLNESVTYSIIASSDEDYNTGYFSVTIRNTWLRFPNADGWNQPERDLTDACQADDSDTDTAWDAIVFQPNGAVTLFDAQDAPSPYDYFDTESFFYSGDNHQGVVPGSAPTTCPILGSFLAYADTGSYVLASPTTPNNTYTIVVSSYYGSSEPYPAAYIYYLFTGFPLGYTPSYTTGGGNSATTGSNPTTGQFTTGSATITTGSNPTNPPTNVPTSAPTGPTNTPTARPTNTPTRAVNVTTTSGASAVAASTLVFAAVVVALF